MDLRHGKGTEYDNNGEPLYGGIIIFFFLYNKKINNLFIGEIEWLFDKP